MVDPSLLESFSQLPNDANHVFIGADVGRTHDKTSVVIGRASKQTIFIEDIKEFTGMPWKDQLQMMKDICAKLSPAAGLIDAGGIGSMLAEEVNRACPRV